MLQYKRGQRGEWDTDRQCCHEVLTIKLGDGDRKIPYLHTTLCTCVNRMQMELNNKKTLEEVTNMWKLKHS